MTDPEALAALGAWCAAHPHLTLVLHGTPRQWGEGAGRDGAGGLAGGAVPRQLEGGKQCYNQ